MTNTFQQAFDAVKAHFTELLTECGENIPNEDSCNRIIENSLLKLFDDLQDEVRDHNEIMGDVGPDSVTLGEVDFDNSETSP